MSDLIEAGLGAPAASEGAGDDMHIHKPKAAHGVREFLSEISVIVVGVLIALALEQAVEWMHWQHVLEEERTSLNDTSEELFGSELVRVDLQPCVDRRLADIAAILKRHDAGEPLGITGPVGRPSTIYGDLSAFDMALADQAFSHMSIKEKKKYFDIRQSAQLFRTYTDNELDTWRTLKTIDRAQTFTPTDWAEVRKAHDRAADLNDVIKSNLGMESWGQRHQWLFPFRGMARPEQAGVRSVRNVSWVKQLCSPSIVR